MGRFTALADPIVDQTIDAHLKFIVTTILCHIRPQAIILRGSFGRGEGSVIKGASGLYFPGDYEIDVATFSPLYRSLFSELSRKLSKELCVDTGVRWVRPDYLYKNRVGPFAMGPPPITISLYESRYGSLTLYGKDFINSSPSVDPGQIMEESGIQLLLNRMAESLSYMNLDKKSRHDELDIYYWINKTILACAESLLLCWKQYHYSYKERGRRFEAIAGQRLSFMHDQGTGFTELVARATEFKLRPRLSLYPQSVKETWLQVTSIVDTVFRYLTERILNFTFHDYLEFSEQYLRSAIEQNNHLTRVHFWTLKLLEANKCLQTHNLSKKLLKPIYINQYVYAMVPMLFFGSMYQEGEKSFIEVKQQLSELGLLKPQINQYEEWNDLQQSLTWYWKVYCY